MYFFQLHAKFFNTLTVFSKNYYEVFFSMALKIANTRFRQVVWHFTNWNFWNLLSWIFCYFVFKDYYFEQLLTVEKIVFNENKNRSLVRKYLLFVFVFLVVSCVFFYRKIISNWVKAFPLWNISNHLANLIFLVFSGFNNKRLFQHVVLWTVQCVPDDTWAGPYRLINYRAVVVIYWP